MDFERVVEAFERQRVFGETGNTIVSSIGTERNEYVIVLDLGAVCERDDTLVGIEIRHLAFDKSGGGRFDLLDWNRDMLFDRGIADHAVGLV